MIIDSENKGTSSNVDVCARLKTLLDIITMKEYNRMLCRSYGEALIALSDFEFKTAARVTDGYSWHDGVRGFSIERPTAFTDEFIIRGIRVNLEASPDDNIHHITDCVFDVWSIQAYELSLFLGTDFRRIITVPEDRPHLLIWRPRHDS